MRKIVNAITGEVTEDPDFVPEPVEPIPLPPVTSVTARQARIWLFRNGFTNEDIKSAIESSLPASDAAEALIEWEYSTKIYRDDRRVISVLKRALRLSDEDINNAFEEASKI